MTSNSLVSWRDNQLERTGNNKLDRHTSQLAQFGHNAIFVENVNRAIHSTVIYNTAELGDDVMTCLDALRRHEARSTADDPLTADDYARVRRAVVDASIEQINRYARRR